MLNWRIALAIACVGVAVALLPVVIYIRAGIGSQLQYQFNTILPIIPLHLLTAIIGAAITITGLLLFVKSWRIYIEQRVFHRPSHAPISSSQPPVGGEKPIRIRKPSIEGSREEIEFLERELNEIIMRGVDIKSGEEATKERTLPSTQPSVNSAEIITAPLEEEPKGSSAGLNITVVVRGVDEVCRACGSVNPLGARVCSECGEKMYIPKPDEPSCPICGAPLSDAQQIGENYVCQVCFSELRVLSSL